jgi:pimeloyl-ACP methyl ester carboxylesterase
VTVAVALALAAVTFASARADTPRWKTLSPPPAMPTPAASGNVRIGDVTLHWAAYGDADAPPVVLLHGGMGSGDDFANQVPALAPHLRVIVVDSRGHGRSTRGASGISYHLMGEDLVALLDHLAIARAALVGWSDGGIVALDVAIHHPDRVTQLVVTGTNYARSGARPAGKGTPFDAYYARCLVEYKRLAPDPEQLTAFRRDLRAMWRREPAYTRDQLRAITAPLLVIHGARDEIIKKSHVIVMNELVPDARLVVVEDASHFVMWQDPAAFNQALLAFLRAPAR